MEKHKHNVFKSSYALCAWRVHCPYVARRTLGFFSHDDALRAAITRSCCNGK